MLLVLAEDMYGELSTITTVNEWAQLSLTSP